MSNRIGTGYINADKIIKVNKNFKFLNIYQNTISKKINDTYNIYLNKSIDVLPNSLLRVELVSSVMERLNSFNYNDLAKDGNILTQDELNILNGIRTYINATSTQVLVPQAIIDELNAEVAKFRNLEVVLADPLKREYYFKTYSTDIEYTKGEAEYDALIIGNSDNLASIYAQIKVIADDLEDRISGPVNGINAKVTSSMASYQLDAIDFRNNYKNLVKYLYYGIKDPDNLSNVGLVYEDLGNPSNTDTFVKMKEFFTTKYPTVYKSGFDRFSVIQSGKRSYQSYRYLITKLAGGTFNGLVPTSRYLDTVNNELFGKLSQYHEIPQPDPRQLGTLIEKYKIHDYSVPVGIYINSDAYLSNRALFTIGRLIQFSNVPRYTRLIAKEGIYPGFDVTLPSSYNTNFIQPLGFAYYPYNSYLVANNIYQNYNPEIYGYGDVVNVGTNGGYLSQVFTTTSTNILNDLIVPAIYDNAADNRNFSFVRNNLLHKANLLKLLNTDGTSFSNNEFTPANIELAMENTNFRCGLLSSSNAYSKLTSDEQRDMGILIISQFYSLIDVPIKPQITWVESIRAIDSEYSLEFVSGF